MSDFYAIIAALEAKRDALTAAIDGLRALDGDVAPAEKRAPKKRTDGRTDGRSKKRAARSLPDDAGILEQLRKHGEPMTPRELAQALKIQRPALTHRMKPLLKSGAVLATGATMNRQFKLPARSRAKEAP
jgi:DNA-binding transcriptional ArsR family regulator